jgi:Fe2+ transport system protein B
MSAQIPTRQRRWLGLQMLEGDIYSRAYAGDAADKLDIAWRISATRSTTRRCISLTRYQTIAAICDAVSNTLTAEPSRFTAAMDKVILNRFLGLPIFLFVMYLMFLLAINIGGALQPILMPARSRSLFTVFMAGLHPALPGLADRVPRPGDRRRYQHRAAAGAADRHDVSVPLLP